MSYYSQERNGNGNDKSTKTERVKGKEVSPIGQKNFNDDNFLPKLPNHEPLDSGGVKAPGFQNLRKSTIRRNSI